MTETTGVPLEEATAGGGVGRENVIVESGIFALGEGVDIITRPRASWGWVTSSSSWEEWGDTRGLC